jgi:gamma-glutamyltranspeptidase/glutathione hydrolase
MKRLLLFCMVLTILSCQHRRYLNKVATEDRGLITTNAMVVSARVEASKIGTLIMQKGGNVFDAMMATQMALAVVYPYAGNLGGGGFLVYRLADGTKGALDFREKAPLHSYKDMYLDTDGNIVKGLSTVGALSIGVPGTIAGIFKAHERFGRLKAEDILQPVIDLAEKGFVITEKQALSLNQHKAIFEAVNKKQILFSKHYKTGDTLKNPELGKTLRRLSDKGVKEFYEGETAEALVRFLHTHGSIITLDDLKRYEAKWRNPVTFTYDDLVITSMSPPSSGGLVLQQIMKMIEPFKLKSYGHNSLKTIQVLVEAEKRAYADRSYYLGDPDFVTIPDSSLTSDSYIAKRMADFTFAAATPVESISHGYIPGYESNETTHYSIVDPFGNAIAVTTTLNGAYGSKLYADELGFFLNNEMDDFSSKPGSPNYYGLIGAEANSIAPEKRMLSSMTPTIIEKDNKLYMTLGTPGGSTIITSVLQTILNVHEFNFTMQEAVNAARFHHQWLPDEIRMEPKRFKPSVINKLEKKGYLLNFERTPVIGKVDGILVLKDGRYEGGADFRGDDTAIGY